MFADLFEDGVEQGEGAGGEAVLPLRGLGPEGEEGGGEVSFAGGGEGEMAGSVGGVEGAGEVPGLIQNALRGVDVGVDDEGAAMDCERIRLIVHDSASFGDELGGTPLLAFLGKLLCISSLGSTAFAKIFILLQLESKIWHTKELGPDGWPGLLAFIF